MNLSYVYFKAEKFWNLHDLFLTRFYSQTFFKALGVVHKFQHFSSRYIIFILLFMNFLECSCIFPEYQRLNSHWKAYFSQESSLWQALRNGNIWETVPNSWNLQPRGEEQSEISETQMYKYSKPQYQNQLRK